MRATMNPRAPTYPHPPPHHIQTPGEGAKDPGPMHDKAGETLLRPTGHEGRQEKKRTLAANPDEYTALPCRPWPVVGFRHGTHAPPLYRAPRQSGGRSACQTSTVAHCGQHTSCYDATMLRCCRGCISPTDPCVIDTRPSSWLGCPHTHPSQI